MSKTWDVAIIGGGHRRDGDGDGPRVPARAAARGHPRGRGRAGRAPDGQQQRRHPLGPLLQARVAQGAQLRRGARGDVPLLRGARHCARPLRQAGRGHRAATRCPRSRSWSAAASRTASRDSGGCEAAELTEYEPHVAGIAGLHVHETGIVDYTAVTDAFARLVGEAGGEVRTAARVTRRAAAERRPGARDGGRRGRGPGAHQLRRAAVGPGGAAVRRRARRQDRPVPRRVLRARPGAAVARAQPDLPGARPAVPVPRRALHAHDPRRHRGRPERRARVPARGLHADQLLGEGQPRDARLRRLLADGRSGTGGWAWRRCTGRSARGHS